MASQAPRRRQEERAGLVPKGVQLPPDGATPQPFQRNLLRNPNPEGVNIWEPAPLDAPRMSLDLQGIFRNWQIQIEPLPADGEKPPLGLVSPCYRWCVREQLIDLLAEGLWEELLDSTQPRITVMDWYENSKLASSVYELHVRLLGIDRAVVVAEFHYVSGESKEDAEKNWCQVSHVFKRYGPGVRFVQFLQKTKDVETPAGYLRTRATDSSVSVQLWD